MEGFLEGCHGSLTAKEIETLPMGAKIMTLEVGMRFLTDYLEGDKYYKVHRPGKNLDRCRLGALMGTVESFERLLYEKKTEELV